ncbi:MAG: hypothetical protein RMK18_12405 [Armatimonadota bacterium]|nr:hypothetical protein [Armatimonadota bacterium]MDW8026648.1 hypothetical protein [Armatimonadota bacterium]
MISKDKILIIFCIIDDVIKALGIQNDKQQGTSESEVLTIAGISKSLKD